MAAVAAEQKNLTFLSTLGVAQYRTKKYDEAYTTLARCDELRQQQGRKSMPPHLAVLSMALLNLGRTQEAQAMFERLEQLMNNEEEGLRLYSEAARDWYEECKQLLEGSRAPTGPLQNTEGEV